MEFTLGAHVDQTDPLAEASARSADLVQFFLGDPQGWKGPKCRVRRRCRRTCGPTPRRLVCSSTCTRRTSSTWRRSNNRIRIPSRKLLQQHVDGRRRDRRQGPDRARRPRRRRRRRGGRASTTGARRVERLEAALPILIENTAGGDNAMARRFDALARCGRRRRPFDVGFCLDTCHAHAGGEDLADVVERAMAITGRIDLVHCNDSRDAFDSGATGTPTSDPARSTPSDPRGRAGGRCPGRRRDPGRSRRPGRRHRLAARAPALTPAPRARRQPDQRLMRNDVAQTPANGNEIAR